MSQIGAAASRASAPNGFNGVAVKDEYAERVQMDFLSFLEQ
jgi:hypothetical protein